MIYIHDDNGNVANTYKRSSDIEYILEYDCRGKHIGLEIDLNEARHIHVACPDESYLIDWVTRHEICLDTIHHLGSTLRYTTPDLCVAVGDGYYSVFMRSPIKIDWSKDYHFYQHKGHTVTQNTDGLV